MSADEIERRERAWHEAVRKLEAAQAAGLPTPETSRLAALVAKTKAQLDEARGGDWDARRRVYVWGNPRG